ncbi:hypothetical protein CXU20_03375 [Akkermansia muciniphila]|nr:hypothetical protein CXU20_03375 [Akkermansia muciniphila]GLV01840.1 hypothetical protein Aksp01_00230 [Akkermansia sp. NBRC 115031]
MKTETGPVRRQGEKTGEPYLPNSPDEHAPLPAWPFSPGLRFRAKNSCNPSAEAENALPAAQRAVPWNPEP